jgi:restriction endonuclease S subunit
MTFGAFMGCIRVSQKLLPQYLFYLLKSQAAIEYFQSNANTTTNISNLNFNVLADYSIPLPPLEIQQKIVAEIEQYQKVIDGAKLVVDNYKPKIIINPEWRKVKLGDICTFMTGGTPKSDNNDYYGGDIKWLVSGDIHKFEIFDCDEHITELGLNNSNAKYLPLNSVLIALNGQGRTRGSVAILKTIATCNQSIVAISPISEEVLLSEFLLYMLSNMYHEIRQITGDNQRSGLNIPLIKQIEIFLPNLEMQHDIVNKIQNERQLVSNNKKLIDIMQDKINQIISQIWINTHE